MLARCRRSRIALLALLLTFSPALAVGQAGVWSRAHEFRGIESGVLVLDTARDRMFLIGGRRTGRVTDEVFVSPASGTPAWRYFAATGTPPPGRHGHAAVYDAARDRIFMIGGKDDAAALPATLWALQFAPDGSGAWQAVSTSGAASAGYGCRLAIDPLRDQLLLFSGGAGVIEQKIMRLPLSGPAVWSAITTTEPGPTTSVDARQVFLDPAGDRVVLAGLIDGAFGVSTLALSGVGADWVPRFQSSNVPGVRTGSVMAFDPVRRLATCFGGFLIGSSLAPNDVWQLSLSGAPTWQLLTLTGPAPSARGFSQAAYDAVRDRLVLFGGGESGSIAHPEHEDDTWALPLASPNAWQLLQASSPRPSSSLKWHTTNLDVARDRMIVLGGDPGRPLDHVLVWPLTGDTRWQELPTHGTPPPFQSFHSATLDAGRDRLIVLGGGATSAVWTLALGTMHWDQIAVSGAPSGLLSGHTAVLDVARDRLLVSRDSVVNALSLSGTPAWSVLPTTGPGPSLLSGHSAIVDAARDRMIVTCGAGPTSFGGVGGETSRTWALSLDGSPVWTELAPGPIATRNQRAVLDPSRDRMLVYGGFYMTPAYPLAFQTVGNLRAYSLSSGTWTTLSTTNSPRRRSDHGLFIDPHDGALFTFAGTSDNQDGQDLDFTSTDVWRLSFTSTLDAPEPPATPRTMSAIAFPNPTRGSLTLRYVLPQSARTTVRVYDAQGRLVRDLLDAVLAPGTHSTAWDGCDAAGAALRPGLYLSEVRSGGSRRVVRWVRMR